MAHYPIAILDRLAPDWKEMKVNLVTFPVPPVPAHEVFFAVDSWSSNTLERGSELFQGYLASRFTMRGPAFLIQRPLGDLLQCTAGGNALVSDPVFCSSVSYQPIVEEAGMAYANRAKIEKVHPINSSSHPASHTVAPAAPFLTLLLMLGRDRENVGEFKFADDQSAANYFPGWDWFENQQIDRMFRFLTISNTVGHPVWGKTWSMPRHLSRPLVDRVRTTLISNERLSRLHPDPLELVETIRMRDAILSAPKEA